MSNWDWWKTLDWIQSSTSIIGSSIHTRVGPIFFAEFSKLSVLLNICFWDLEDYQEQIWNGGKGTADEQVIFKKTKIAFSVWSALGVQSLDAGWAQGIGWEIKAIHQLPDWLRAWCNCWQDLIGFSSCLFSKTWPPALHPICEYQVLPSGCLIRIFGLKPGWPWLLVFWLALDCHSGVTV